MGFSAARAECDRIASTGIARDAETLRGTDEGESFDLDQSLGLSHIRRCSSRRCCLAEPYLAFVHHVMSERGEVRGRLQHGAGGVSRDCTRPNHHPADAGFVHAAADRSRRRSGSTTSPTARARGPASFRWMMDLFWNCSTAGIRFPRWRRWIRRGQTLGEWLAATQHRLSPRALTLTTFLRMLVADNFVHGIGGGRYDQVSDDIIRNYFKLDPPAFSVTTATMFFPARCTRQRVCVPCVDAGRAPAQACRARRAEEGNLVAQIESAPRRFDGATIGLFRRCTASERRS